jgi:small-conductance mechanosensitive channel
VSLSEWVNSLQNLLAEAFARGSALLPGILGAGIVFLLGLAFAGASRFVVVRLLQRARRLLPGRALADDESDFERVIVRLVGGLVFWLFVLVSAAVAVEVLGLSGLTSTLAGFAGYLPRIIAAVLVMAAGIVAGNLAASWVARTARAANIAYARAASNAVKSAIILVAAVVALTQAGIDSTILVVALGTFLGAFLGAAALAFGLGARTTVSNLIAAHYLQRSYRVNQRIRIGEHRGRILELRPTEVLLETSEGVTLIPAKEFAEQSSVLLGEEG